jgi:hypothetical protein
LSAPIINDNYSVDSSASVELNAENETCDLIVEPNLDHIHLVKSNDVLAVHANSLFSIMMDQPMSLSHARDKIAEITCLSTFKSVYAPLFNFNLIGDYGVDNIFLVHRICIMCDDLAMLKENKLLQMLDHFHMTFNVVDNDMANKLIHDGLSCTRFEHIVNSHGKTMNFSSPMLGWFNDKHCEINYINDCFTYICKLSCDISYWNLCNTLLIHYKQYLCKSINVKNVKGVKMDDIYIYHVHTLSLVLACLQNKHRRGWLSFKEREDDEDMPT